MLVGEIGGDEEEKAARHVAEHMLEAGARLHRRASRRRPGKTMGHAGAIVSGSAGTAQAKKEALEAAGIAVGTTPTELARLVAERSAAADAFAGSRPARGGESPRLEAMESISFARGVPAPECLPEEELADCARDRARARRQDDPLLRLGRRLRAAARADRRVVQGRRPTRSCSPTARCRGSSCSPSTSAAAQTRVRRVADLRPAAQDPARERDDRGRAVGMDDDGLHPRRARARRSRANRSPAFLYTIPTFQNPSGRTIPEERRRQIVELAQAQRASRSSRTTPTG